MDWLHIGAVVILVIIGILIGGDVVGWRLSY